ncbi:endonuclease/exonuclease/phosphatase family protein [Chelatococcus asaccharovorans]|uniref:endonuclease/exonuclease/phosphatase family protein n=1 Tax=Chelatococcus asaccharovorans TaxID=28210 RepID=UPI00224C76A0|nr:endonuclease/exonuclease/phosphatase family protein [Chelatococcus asaccharovorans]CAH1661427.1 Exonuclease III [Chelatococcus asaccharovorans]CAH1689769.1 Exonuclease III [Chelatococcus asaccharovorans]
MKLKVLTYNTLFAGRDGMEARRAKAQIELINNVSPDVFLMQEAKGFDGNGARLLYEMEARIGMRGFLAPAPRTGQNVAIFIRPTLTPLAFEVDSANFHHALAVLTVSLPGTEKQVTFASAHLCPNGPVVRQREAAYLAVMAAPDNLALLAGDFNSASPHDPEPEGFDALSPHHRTRYLAEDLKIADRSVLAHLEAAGWVDTGAALDDHTPTVPSASFVASEFAVMRCDYIMTSKALAALASSYEVIRNPLTDAASDHYPVVATFTVPS